MTTGNLDCQPATNPCWQFYGSHRWVQPTTQWVIDLADATLNLRIRQMLINPSDNDLYAIRNAANACINLRNARWGEINLEPFPFAPYQQVKQSSGLRPELRAILGTLIQRKPSTFKKRAF